MVDHRELRGLYHVSSEPIDKYTLLEMVRSRTNINIEIEPDDTFVLDRSLKSDKFLRETGFSPAGWEELIDEMCSDPTEYRNI